MQTRHRIRVMCLIALILAGHVAVIGSLLVNFRLVARRSNSFEIVLIAPAAAPQRSLRSTDVAHALPRRRMTVDTASADQATLPEAQDNAIHAPIDWAGELTRAAKDAAADKSAPAAKDFGFPRRPAAPTKARQFDWDYAATHRVESIEGGGLIVNLDDHCVLVLLPLPFFACGVGHKAANGELLKHMGEPKDAEPGRAR